MNMKKATHMTEGEFEGKVAIVTGGGRGIGRAVALKLASSGASVVLAARTSEQVNAVAKEVGALNAQALAVPTDVTIEAQVRSLASRTMERFGRVDILVNNTGGGGPYRGPLLEMSVQDWDDVFALNCRSAFLCSREFAPHMIQVGGGVIVNVGSETGRRPTPWLGHYGAAKFAVWGLTQTLAAELGPKNVRVNAVFPGAIRTDGLEDYFAKAASQENITLEAARKRISSKSPMDRLLEVEEMAEVVHFLSSEASKSLVGVIVDANGGALMR